MVCEKIVMMRTIAGVQQVGFQNREDWTIFGEGGTERDVSTGLPGFVQDSMSSQHLDQLRYEINLYRGYSKRIDRV
ncbi:hypothetical protein [Paenibacillus sedimenti]|uniref:Uncharacterized protein n=1 Tax=Paenibacillus sedimenti TaxID=2770274 RepID=A0A926QI33_9BACL|nr:hypothetical protein [Paenibacillus sedimenti]MBD0380171.1 hypothetical protein [Paenibacillus sedimenti]